MTELIRYGSLYIQIQLNHTFCTSFYLIDVEKIHFFACNLFVLLLFFINLFLLFFIYFHSSAAVYMLLKLKFFLCYLDSKYSVSSYPTSGRNVSTLIVSGSCRFRVKVLTFTSRTQVNRFSKESPEYSYKRKN